MSEKLEDQARDLHRVVSSLVKRYQFRDREEICCHGVSVSQCYTLAALYDEGELSMGELAGHMRLTVSTMTRVVDQLVSKELVERGVDPVDRRVCCVRLTGAGGELVEMIQGELLEIEKGVLAQIPPPERQNVIRAIERLSQAIDQWCACCANPKEGEKSHAVDE